MEKEKKQFTISDYIIVIVGFLTMIALVVFWSAPAHASTHQVCDYKITEQDQDFIAWYKENIVNNDGIRKEDYVTIVSGSGYYCIYYTSKPLYQTVDGYNAFQVATVGYQDMYNVDSSGSYSPHIINQSLPFKDGHVGKMFSPNFIFTNYNVNQVEWKKDENGNYTFSPTGEVFFLKPLLPVATLAQEIPKVVKIQVREIVVVAVCCLALLIGSTVLLPKLRLFLS